MLYATVIKFRSWLFRLLQLVPTISLPLPIVISFVCKAISDLLRNKCVDILEHRPDIVNPLSVSIQPSGKKRLILDSRHVNLYVFKRKFRCKDVSVALQIFSEGIFLFKFDLKSGYHHAEIFPDHRNYLAFSWDFGDGVVKYFQFTILPFGLSSALYLFTKLLKPIITSWRCKGIPMAIFLDDCSGVGINSIRPKATVWQFALIWLGTALLLTKRSPFGSLFKLLPVSALFLILIKVLFRLPSEGFQS